MSKIQLVMASYRRGLAGTIAVVAACVYQGISADIWMAHVVDIRAQANVAGYRAVIESANQFGRLFGGTPSSPSLTLPHMDDLLHLGLCRVAAVDR